MPVPPKLAGARPPIRADCAPVFVSPLFHVVIVVNLFSLSLSLHPFASPLTPPLDRLSISVCLSHAFRKNANERRDKRRSEVCGDG